MNNHGKQTILPGFIVRSGLLSMARILQVVSNFLVFWLCSLYLDKTLYGNYQKVFVIIGLVASVLPLGFPLLITTLPTEQLFQLVRTIWRQKKSIYIWLTGIAIAIILVFLSFIPFYIRLLVIIFTLINALYVVVEILCIRHGKDRQVFIANILYAVFFLFLHLLFLFCFVFDIKILLICLCAIAIFRLIFIIFSIDDLRKVYLSVQPLSQKTTVTYVRQWKFLSINEMLETFSKRMDLLFLFWLLPASGFAVYFNGAYEIPLLGILVSAMGTFFNIKITQEKLSDENMLQTFHKSAILLACLLFPLFFFLQFNAIDIFNIFFQNKYADSAKVFIVSSWIIPLRIANYTAILQNKLKGGIIVQGSLAGLFFKTICSILLYYLFDITGVAAAEVIGTFVQIGFYLYKSASILNTSVWKMLPLQWLMTFFALCGLLFWVMTFSIKSFLPLERITCGLLLMISVCLASGFYMYRCIRKNLDGRRK